MNKSHLIGAVCTCIFSLGIMSFAQAATLVLIDDFTITKNGSTIFQDTFNNGVAPPDTGGNTQSYKVFGGPLGPESGGRLTLDARSGQIVTRPSGTMARQGARVKTNIDPLQPTKGLRIDDLFSVTGIFDLLLPTEVDERYGVRLSDEGSAQREDNMNLSVRRTSGSLIEVVFGKSDRDANTSINLGSFTLEAGHDQIAMTLSRLDTANNLITASFAYIDSGVMGATTTFTTTSAIFNGEDFTRGQFMYLAPIPIPAAVWLFGSGLLGLIGIARHNKVA